MPTPLKILIIEDEAIMVRLLKLSLERLGYQLCPSAPNGPEGVRIALEEQPDIIITDVSLHGEMDGLEVVRRIRETSDPGIIFITGYSDPALKNKAMSYNPIGFLIKPFTPDKLVPFLESYQREGTVD